MKKVDLLDKFIALFTLYKLNKLQLHNARLPVKVEESMDTTISKIISRNWCITEKREC